MSDEQVFTSMPEIVAAFFPAHEAPVPPPHPWEGPAMSDHVRYGLAALVWRLYRVVLPSQPVRDRPVATYANVPNGRAYRA